MKIAILTDKLLFVHSNITGSNVQMYNLGRVLSNEANEVLFLFSSPANTTDVVHYNNMKLYNIPVKTRIFSWIMTIGLYKHELDLLQPDILYTRGRSIHVYIASRWAKQNNKKHIWATNGEDSCEKWKRTTRLWSSSKNIVKQIVLTVPFAIEDIFIHWGMRNTTLTINQTTHQYERLKVNWNKAGILLPSIYAAPETAKSKHRNTILWLANIREGKQPELFIKLAQNCASPNAPEFILAGGTLNKNYLSRLKVLARNIPNIHFTGEVAFENTGSLFHNALFLVNTSLPEADGLPNVFIQAWMHGVPVLSLHHNPNNWLNEKAIGYCANGSFNKLLDTCQLWIHNPHDLKHMGTKARQFAHDTFCSAKVKNDYLKLFT